MVLETTKLNSTAVPGSALAIKWFGDGMGVRSGGQKHGGWRCGW